MLSIPGISVPENRKMRLRIRQEPPINTRSINSVTIAYLLLLQKTVLATRFSTAKSGRPTGDQTEVRPLDSLRSIGTIGQVVTYTSP